MRPIPAPPPRVFNYSLDWRFLLPMGDPKNLYLVFEEDIDFRQTLERVGIHADRQGTYAGGLYVGQDIRSNAESANPGIHV
jgi:hypothetical protein